MIWLVLALIVLGLAISLPATAAARAVGRARRAFDTPGAPGHVKVLRDVPNNGGVAIYLAVVPPMCLGLAAAWLVAPESWQRLLPAVHGHLSRIRETTPAAAVGVVSRIRLKCSCTAGSTRCQDSGATSHAAARPRLIGGTMAR